MPIFDDLERTRVDAPHQGEPRFPYLNTSARHGAERVRALVEAWFKRYPEAHREPLIGRFRSSSDAEHHSAFFELFVHELLTFKGHKIVEIEPVVPNSPRRPDFLVETALGSRFYVEAIFSTGLSDEEAGATKRLDAALRAIDTYPSPGHFLDLKVTGTPDKPVTIKALKSELRVFVDGLTPGQRSAAPFLYEEFGMRIRLVAFPKNTPKPGRAIGARHFGVHSAVADEDLRAAILKKAKRYGELPLPFVVAVNTSGFFQEDHDLTDALLGTENTVGYQAAHGKFEHKLVRQPDGIWIGPKGPRKKVLSAVLATREVTPWNFASRIARLIRNPYATYALPPLKLGINEINPVNGFWKETDGVPLGTVMGLPKDWPIHE